MPKFLVMLRNVRSSRVPLSLLLPYIAGDSARFARQLWHEEIELDLTDDQVEAMREAVTDLTLRRHLPAEGQNLQTIVSLYFRQELQRIAPTATDIRAIQIPEPMPPEAGEDSTPHPDCRCVMCKAARAGNPGLSDPWARGW